MLTNQEIQERLQSDYDLLAANGYEVVGVFLFGSQNYKLDHDNSDMDVRGVVIGKPEDIAMATMVEHRHIIEIMAVCTHRQFKSFSIKLVQALWFVLNHYLASIGLLILSTLLGIKGVKISAMILLYAIQLRCVITIKQL